MARNPPTSQSRTRAALALMCLFGLATPAAADALEIRYREGRAGAVIVPVRVQGLGPFDFLLDTGADTTVVHPDLAARAGLTPTARIELVTVAGSRLVPQAPGEVSLEGRPLGRLDVLIHDLPATRAQDPTVLGILGRDAFHATPFAIDHVRRQVVLGGPPAAGGVPYEEVGGRPVVWAHLRCGGPPLRLALDSGASGLILFAGARPLPLVTDGRRAAQTNAGTAWVRAARLESLCVGRARLGELRVAVLDTSAGPRGEDGLLPTSLFARVHFDPRAKTVKLDPR
jgi:hypothetical protein